jgi:hypothetical protein
MFREKLVYVVVCKHCGMEGSIEYSESPADSTAKPAGWKIVGEDYYCPEHIHSPLMGPKELQEFAQHLKRFVLEQERKTANFL